MLYNYPINKVRVVFFVCNNISQTAGPIGLKFQGLVNEFWLPGSRLPKKGHRQEKSDPLTFKKKKCSFGRALATKNYANEKNVHGIDL